MGAITSECNLVNIEGNMDNIGRHNEEIRANQGFFKKKPLLEDVYRDFYGTMAEEIND